MSAPELVLRFPNSSALLQEHADNLSHGRAFVPLATELGMFASCSLRLVHPAVALELQIPCQVVMVVAEGEHRGTALQFLDRGEATMGKLRDFVAAQPSAARPSESEHGHSVPPECDEDESEQHDDEEHDDGEHGTEGQRAIVAARALKLRNLTPAQRMQVARGSVLEERVLLERLYGSAVWELLLHNPKITVPEVARMARKGTMPRPLLDAIADNEQWIRHSLIRRALLANPRLSSDGINRVLRTLPPRELKLVPQQTAYPPMVRQAASRLMRG